MIKIIIIFIWKYLICLEKWNIANDGLVGREQERWSDSQWQQFSVWHTTSTWFGIRGGDVRQSRTEFTAQNFRHTNSLNRFLPSCKKKKITKKDPKLWLSTTQACKYLLIFKTLPTRLSMSTADCNLEVPSSTERQPSGTCLQSNAPTTLIRTLDVPSENQMPLWAL